MVLMSAVTSAYIIRNFHINVWLALLIVVIEGIIMGGINGLIIAKLKINPLIATLAMMSILTGLIHIITKGVFINVKEESFRFLGNYRLFNIKFLQLPIIILICFFIIFSMVLKYTCYGKYVYAIGGNKIAAKFSGINVNLITTSVYMISGFVCGVGGYILASRIGSAQPNIAGFFPLDSIAAVALGGVSLAGGRGSLWGTFMGLLILGTVNVGLLGLGFETYIQYIAAGFILIIAVSLMNLENYKYSQYF